MKTGGSWPPCVLQKRNRLRIEEFEGPTVSQDVIWNCERERVLVELVKFPGHRRTLHHVHRFLQRRRSKRSHISGRRWDRHRITAEIHDGKTLVRGAIPASDPQLVVKSRHAH